MIKSKIAKKIKLKIMEDENHHDIPEYDLTMHSIYRMYCYLFQKLGWMILSKNKDNSESLEFYIRKIKQLKKNIENREKMIKNDIEKKDDCKTMIKNLDLLLKHSMKDLKENKVKLDIKKIDASVIEYDTTMYGIYKWYDSMFEKLGWMVIAENKKDSEKIHTYYNCILKLYKALHNREMKSKDVDRKIDYKLMMENILILINHVHNDFMM